MYYLKNATTSCSSFFPVLKQGMAEVLVRW